MDGKQVIDPLHRSELQTVFDFTVHDVAVYRKGRLSDDYRIQNANPRNQRKPVWIVGRSLLAFGVMGVTFANNNAPLFAWFLLAGFIIVPLIWDLYQTQFEEIDFENDMADGRVGVVTGHIKRKEKEGDDESGWIYKIHISGPPFIVDKKQYETLLSGVNYTVYFLPRSGTILAVEPSPK